MTDSLTITLEPETEARIQAHVDAGEFASPDEVVRAGLNMLETGGWTTEELRAMIAEADRDGGDYSAEEVEAHLDETFRDLEAKFQR